MKVGFFLLKFPLSSETWNRSLKFLILNVIHLSMQISAMPKRWLVFSHSTSQTR